ncbi:MAG: septal ring lytic transglycosylase RlpA family lipoprotein [Proteobacteria bacterium]|nr:MAG: septal ring lytic transglycosylase RlpA family lipoprotein [Pseudomonadota bacterium]
MSLTKRRLSLASLALLAACSSAPVRQGGGYYLDDGPGANPPPNLERTPDAVPTLEPIKASTARPYTVMGRTYVPLTQPGGYRARGTASWYGRRYHGQPTSSGERYDMYAMTAAHTTLPIPSYAKVTNVSNGKTVVVRINDRGPFRGDRLIDLSYVAAYKLNMLGPGSALVEVESILPGAPVSSPVITARADPQPEPLPAADPPVSAEVGGVYVQLGAFSQRANADSFLTRMRTELAWLAESLNVEAHNGLYRVRAGPYADRAQAGEVAQRIEQALDLKPALTAH